MAKAISNILDQGSAVRVENYPYHLTDTLVKVLIPEPTDPLKLSGSPMIQSIGSGIRSTEVYDRSLPPDML